MRLPRRKKSPPKTKGESSRPTALPVKQTVRGQIKYPWGGVAYAIVSIGGRSVTAGRDGKYEITDIDAGTHIVSAKAPFPGYEPASQDAALPVGETKVVDLYLDFEKTLVHGYVYGADGKPLAGATVSGIMSGKDVETAVTDEKGYFRFDRASPGYQFVRINAAGYMGQTHDFTAKKNEETKLDFHLTPGTCRIYGTVVDENDKPLRSAVILSSGSGVILQKTETSTETGYYELSVLPGTYNLLAKGTDYRSEGWRGSISADRKVDFKLEPHVPLDISRSAKSSFVPKYDPRRPRMKW
ncbi:MSCRAMM family protein [[Eubacterium] cellulosolvens]